MKRFLIPCCLLISIISEAQKTYVKEVELAENHFALESQVIGIKAGFLKNMDTAAVGINQAGFVRMFQVWTNRQEVKSTLIWEPKSVFASENGLWGSTHGPWYTKDSSGKLVNPGYFFTIWERKNINEPYKFSLDMGIQLSGIATIEQASSLPLHSVSLSLSPSLSPQGQSLKTKKLEPPLDFFTTSSSKSLSEALEKYTVNETAILVSGNGRILKPDIKKVNGFKTAFQFSPVKYFELELNKAMYEYGTIRFNPEPGKEVTGSYVHIWINGNGKPVIITAFYKWD